ncbi:MULTISPECIES: DUF4143 domain-containing protein [unclassified Actinomyces]|uniref:ATP-binding protein n=1 Tax=unclassified Actinomyces TaxID=2609248 RepID=UPI0020173C1A|nr:MULTISPECIES: DUF4143 domain-containing protein [unclassified Actinomyces]MCL3777431.1 ATP-binding protein [Actinomyces sp. AC-20-1]MCL3789752.1 ATP-binding protein [Actinomyces sp. 187325]MCL3792110.1 ATP-binding protein [Actinomyces sp. 186855]MCL3794806.1 ATP-binding protein [Actinomyces sp. 217892]
METEQEAGIAYLPRAVDVTVAETLKSVGAVVLEGPRGCGKTMTGLHHAGSYVLLDTPEAQAAADVDPRMLLEGEAPRLLDEWQTVPQVWNLARRAVDFSNQPGRFILTGSAVPTADSIRHTGASRFVRIRQRTMTWAEKTGELTSPGVRLCDLFAGSDLTSSMHASSLADVVDNLLIPGFPALRNATAAVRTRALTGYLRDTATTDLGRLAMLRSEPVLVEQMLAALARSTATDVSQATLRRDIARVLPAPSEATVAKLLELLQRVFVVEAVPPWTTALRSKARLRRSSAYHLADPALAAAALGAGAARLKRDLETLGFLFESAVVHDLLVYAEAAGGRVYRYRDSNGHEIDAVITMPDGAWAAVEVKLGGGQVSAGAARLVQAVAQLDAPPPAFRAVITGTGFTATLPDGTLTFPLDALRP